MAASPILRLISDIAHCHDKMVYQIPGKMPLLQYDWRLYDIEDAVVCKTRYVPPYGISKPLLKSKSIIPASHNSSKALYRGEFHAVTWAEGVML